MKTNTITLLLLFFPFACLSIFASNEMLINFFPDDSFYYLKTAYNFISIHKLSFDGVNTTNGFHPLFFVVISIVSALTGKQMLLNAAFLLNGLFIYAGVFLILFTLNKRLTSVSKLLITTGLGAAPFFIFIWISCGMEAGLVLFCTCLFFMCWCRAHEFKFRHLIANGCLGLSISLMMLARLDMILVLTPFILYLGWELFLNTLKKKNQLNTLRLSTILIIPLLSGITYLTINLTITGHLIPISGAVKQIYRIPFEMSWRGSTLGGNIFISAWAAMPLILSCTIPAVLYLKKESFSKGELSGLILLNISVLIFYFYLRFFASNFFFWYFSFPMTAAAINIAEITAILLPEKLLRHPISDRVKATAVLFAILVNSLFLVMIGLHHESTSYHLNRIAEKVNQNIDPGKSIGVFDAGVIGFFAEPRIINLDGLANSYDYFLKYRIPGKIFDYFKDRKIDYFLVRDALISNLEEVESGDYERAALKIDARFSFQKKDEIFRYQIPGSFAVICFRFQE